MTNIIIIGAGSVGCHIVCNIRQYFPNTNVIGFLDDDQKKIGKKFFNIPVIGSIDSLPKFGDNIGLVVGIAFPQIKKMIIERITTYGQYNFPSLISNHAWISNKVTIGEGTIIYPGASVNYNTKIGAFSILNLNCAIGHDCIINDYSSLAPSVSLAGHTKVGNECELGIGSCSIQSVSIGNGAVIGAGTVLIRDVPDYAVVVGNPGKVIKYNK